ncbi:MAG: DOMON domain-containing protein, partial [Atribacterota bacterium]|nr:DOMON domain-containing protein [Atribacterota bacterium]
MKKLFWWLTIIFLFLSYTGELTAELRQDKKQVEEDFGYKIDNYKADGIISDGEYENRSVYRDLEIYWSNDNKYLYMALRGKTKGYISIGFQPGSMMKDADIIMGYVQDEKVEVFDQYG